MKYLTILNTKLLTDFIIKILISNTILLEYYLSYAKLLARQATAWRKVLGSGGRKMLSLYGVEMLH